MKDLFEPFRNRLEEFQRSLRGKPHFEWAQVTSASPLRIQFAYDTSPLPITPSTLVAGLEVGDLVRVEKIGAHHIIHGAGKGKGAAAPASQAEVNAGSVLNKYVSPKTLADAPVRPHTHSAADITSGTLAAARFPTGAISPPGAVTAFAGSSTPSGWLLCNGAAVSRTTYAALFAAIGTTFGSGNGSSTFNLPDLRGRVPVGYTTADTEFNAVGKTFGAKTHTLTESQMPSHNHPPGSGASAFWGTASGANREGLWNPTNWANLAVQTTTGNRGGGGAHNNIQPSIALNFIIKT